MDEERKIVLENLEKGEAITHSKKGYAVPTYVVVKYVEERLWEIL